MVMGTAGVPSGTQGLGLTSSLLAFPFASLGAAVPPHGLGISIPNAPAELPSGKGDTMEVYQVNLKLGSTLGSLCL